MYSFSPESIKQLTTAEADLEDLFKRVIKNYDCTVIQGHRSKKEQDEYFRTGKSKVQYPNSRHNRYPSQAVDVAPYPIDWNNTKRFYHFAGFVQATAKEMGINLRWGGDWDRDNDLDDQSFMDLVHFEIR